MMDSILVDKTTLQPGLYQTNCCGLTLKECRRFGTIWTFPIVLILKLIGKKINLLWLPAHESEVCCGFDELSARAKEILEPKVKTACDLGYPEGIFRKVIKSYDKSFHDAGSYIALHHDRRRIIMVSYVSQYYEDTLTQADKIVAQASYFIDPMNDVTVMNHQSYLDVDKKSHPAARNIYLYEADLDILAGRIEREFNLYDKPVLRFYDIQHVIAVLKQMDEKIWLDRLKRGLIEKVPPEKEEEIIKSYNAMKDNKI